jgi:hypothetical protein
MKIIVELVSNRSIKEVSGVFNIVSLANNNSFCKTGNNATDLESLINNYRKSNGLPALPLSSSLAKVAKAHVKDVAIYHPENKCSKGNEHSWSSNGQWKGGCYEPKNSSTFKIMWLKPKEIADDNNFMVMRFFMEVQPLRKMLNGWKTSSGHNDVILNKGVWSGYKWTGMAAANYGAYWVVWFE